MKTRSFARLPLGVKIPLAAGALVLVVGIVLSTAAYVAVKQATLNDANDRLTPLTNQLATNYRASLDLLRGRIRAPAEHPALSRFLADSSPANRVEALQPTAPPDTLVMANELRDWDGRILLAAGREPERIAANVQREWIPASAEHPDSVTFGTFRAIGDSGIGLGLAVSKPLAQANGGDLVLASQPARGATFVFAMPAAP